MNNDLSIDKNSLEEESRAESRIKGDELTKANIQRLQREIDTYKQMKHEEEKLGVSNGRRRWLNHQISEKREKIQELEKEL